MIKKYKIAYLFIFGILLSPFTFKVCKIPLNIIIFVFIITIFFISKRFYINIYSRLLFHKYTILVLIFNINLLISVLIGLNYPNINTHIYSDPIIPEYYKSTQIILGLFYNNLLFMYIFVFYYLIQNKNYSSKKILDSIIKIIYYFALFNVFINFIEFMFPSIHKNLMLIAGYHKMNYYFVMRPVSIVLNSYINAFLSAFFSFWSLHLFDKSATKWKKLAHFILFVVGVIGTFISGARFSLILLFISSILYLFLRRKTKIIFLTLLLIIIIILFLRNTDYFYLLTSIFTLSDKVGSANLHWKLFYETLHIFINNIWGIGIGKMDFGALNTIPNLAYNSESYLLSLLLGGGLVTFIVYLTIHMNLLIKLFKYKIFSIFSFNLSVLIVSLINIQILQSVTSTAIIAVLYTYAFFYNEKEFLEK